MHFAILLPTPFTLTAPFIHNHHAFDRTKKSSLRPLFNTTITRSNTFSVRATRKDQTPAVDDDDDGDQSPLLGNSAILSACFVGLLTGISVVLFNYGVHEIRDLCWGELPVQGASLLRDESIETKWQRVILVPVFGGFLVSLLNIARTATDDAAVGTFVYKIRSSLKPILKAVAACVTLGTGNALGPEGPSVEIGVSVAKGVGAAFDRGAQRKLSLRASGSAAGLSSGFNAAVAGCFFAVETVLWPSATEESSSSLTYTTSMVILSAVTASVISEIGLGSEPAFAVPIYDFRSPSELPLYLLLGALCGLVSVGLSKCTSFMLVLFDGAQRTVGMPKASFPVIGGFAVGLIALAYPEILYWGFQNVDAVLESRPFVNSLSANLLVQLVLAKIIATSLCRASGLVGGYYAPSLFIGAATGMAYGKIVGFVISASSPIFHLSFLEVASPQAYGLVGMAATLAGVCQVPLTAVLLLFELTQDYRIVLPLLGAVGLSSWITSGSTRKKDNKYLKDRKDGVNNQEGFSYDSSVKPTSDLEEPNGSSICELESSLCLNEDSDGDLDVLANNQEGFSYDSSVKPISDLEEPNGSSICDLGSSLCLNEDSDGDLDDLSNEILVSQVMRTRFVSVLMNTYVTDVVSLMLEEKQSFALIVDENTQLVGQLTLSDIQQFIESPRVKSRNFQVLTVSELCSSGRGCAVSWTVTPSMSLFRALTLMNRHRMSQLPVIVEHGSPGGCPIGLLDRESIDLAFRAFAIREGLGSTLNSEENKELRWCKTTHGELFMYRSNWSSPPENYRCFTNINLDFRPLLKEGTEFWAPDEMFSIL